MKIKNTDYIKTFITELMDTNDLNISMSEMFLSLFSNHEITSEEELKVLAKRSNQSIHEVYLQKICDYWEIDLDDEENLTLYKSYIEPNIIKADINKYKNNPYYKSIKITDNRLGNFRLIYDHYKPYEIFPLKDIEVDNNYVEHTEVGYFEEEFPFVALNENNVTWMSVTPNEIETMEEGISKAHGDIIVFGLGIGYFAYMAALKNEVKSVTIVEKDWQIIDLFEKFIFPSFTSKEKIKIIKDDAFNYLSSPLKYDFAFVDLWHSQEDGLDIFLRFKANEKLSPNCEFSYWLNKSFYALLRRAFIILLFEQLEGYKESNYKNSETIFDRLINDYYFKTKNLVINSVEEIRDLLTDEKLLEIIL